MSKKVETLDELRQRLNEIEERAETPPDELEVRAEYRGVFPVLDRKRTGEEYVNL